jgi:hypothetical protein
MTARFPLDRAYNRTLNVNYPEDVKRYGSVARSVAARMIRLVMRGSFLPEE